MINFYIIIENKKPEVDAPGLKVNQNCCNNSEKECLLIVSASISISEFLCNNKNKGVDHV